MPRISVYPVPPFRYLLYLDPGETTGWCLYDSETGTVIIEEVEGFGPLCRNLERWMSGTGGPKTVLGCERYVLTETSARRDPTGIAMRIYGVAEWMTIRWGAVEFSGRQNSNDALGFVSDGWLTRVGNGWAPLGMPHGRDAARHVIRWLEDRDLLPARIRHRMIPA